MKYHYISRKNKHHKYKVLCFFCWSFHLMSNTFSIVNTIDKVIKVMDFVVPHLTFNDLMSAWTSAATNVLIRNVLCIWSLIRVLLEGINLFIPHKTAKARRGLPSDPPENCHLNVKKLPKTWHFFQKNWQKLSFFPPTSTYPEKEEKGQAVWQDTKKHIKMSTYTTL